MNTRRQFLITAPMGMSAMLGLTASCGGEQPGATVSPLPGPPATPGAPPTFGTAPGSGPTVSPSTFAEAERLAQVTMSAAEREMAAATWRQSMAPFLERRVGPRKVALEPQLAPATRWHPLLDGASSGPARDMFVRTRSEAVALPSSDADIAFSPVTQLSRWIERKALTSERLTTIYLNRIDQFDPKLRSIITLTKDVALAQAKKADAEIAAGKYRGPLHGIPYGVKDLLDTAGIATTYGAEPFRNRVPAADSVVVRRLNDAGAVLIAKLSLGALALNDIWFGGQTMNPWLLEEGASGSSAGPGAATAAALVGFSIGSETGGSIVAPAMRCGVTGLRPTFGRVPRTGAMTLCWSLDKLGPMTRGVEDAMLVLQATSGPDAGDVSSVPSRLEFDATASAKGLRVGYFPAWMKDNPATDVDRAALETVKTLGMAAVEVSLPDWPYNALMPVLFSEAAASFEELTLGGGLATMKVQVPDAWPNLFREARFLSAVDFVQADRFRRRVAMEMARVFSEVDLLLVPSLRDEMLTLSNFTGHPSLTLRAGFVNWLHLDPLGRGSNPGAGYYFAYARRKPGVTLAQAEADVKGVAAVIAKLDPASHPSYTARLDDLHEGSVRQIRPTLLLLFAAAGLLLVIACANVAGLLLARSVARARETATRVALGASPRQLALQYFVEGLFVSTAGAAAGVLVSVGLVRWVLSIGSEFVPHPSEIAMDWTVFAFALSMAFLTSALSSLAPLWQAARTSPADVLSAGVRASAGVRVRRLSQSLVVAEMALAFTLLAVGAALIVHLRSLARTSPGFDADRVLTFSVALDRSIESNDASRVSYQRRLVDALEAIPGVIAAGFANQLPLAGCCQSTTIYREGLPVDSIAVERTSYITASPGYFRAMKIPLGRGRFLTDADTSEDPLHVVINQSAATRYWGNDNPLDGFGRLGGATGSRFQVVGVVGDLRNNGLANPTVSEIYLLSSIASANPMRVVVRSALPADALIREVRRAVHGVDATLPIHEVATMDDIVRDSLARERVGSMMSTCFALTALLMATLGIYGLVSYGVRQRTVEIGTRMALGADSRDVLSLVIGGGLKLALAGIVAGAAGVIATASILDRFLEVHDIGWLPFAASTAIVAVVAIAASSFPAWRATRLSPMVALRSL